MPERALLDMLTNVVSWTNCTRHFGPLSGSDPKLKRRRPAPGADDPDACGTIDNYIYLLFAYGTNMGPTQAARHLRGVVSAHTLSYLNRRYVTSIKLDAALADIVNRYAGMRLPRSGAMGRGWRWTARPASCGRTIPWPNTTSATVGVAVWPTGTLPIPT
jgi:hypothetical protein